MRVEREPGYVSLPRDHTHSVREIRHRIPDAWIEAREKAGALPFDETQTIAEVFDRTISRVHGAVWRDKRVLRGVPCLRKTRIPVYQICGMIAEGYSRKSVARYLRISEEQVCDALRFASILLEQ